MNQIINRNILRLAAILLMGLGWLSACRKPDDRELNKGNTPLYLQASKDSLMLKQAEDAADAVIFNWTPGSNQGTNASISYTLLIDKQGANFSNPLRISLGAAVLEQKLSVKTLNDSLLQHWSSTPDAVTVLEAKVESKIAGNAAPGETSNTVLLRVRPYRPVTAQLYLIGDATPNGWNAGSATAMTAVPGRPGQFKWTGNLSVGDFKFITTLGQFLPSYNKGASNTTLLYRTDDMQPDEKFRITQAGGYTVSVDLLNLTISITAGNNPPYSRLWIVGDATPNGWNINNPNALRVDSGNLWLFHYNEVLNAGEFKFPVATGNWSTDFYMPLTNHPALTETTMQLVPGGSPDNKWQISNPGPYKITLNLQNNTISIKPFTPYTQVWMVGDATPAGWNINNPTALTPVAGDPYKFTWTGPMTAGEFKFPLATGNWATDYFMPVIDQSGPGSTQVKFVAGGNPDHKWRITQAGTYKITLDQLRETISIERQ